MFRSLSGLVLLFSTLAFAAPAPPLLPRTFAGWKETASAPASPSATNAAVLGEYGLSRAVTATYVSAANRLAVRAWQFHDATGAYGAFTFFRQEQAPPSIVQGRHYVVWHGTTVVDAVFAHATQGDQGVLNALAAKLPHLQGPDSVPPSLPRYLPRSGLDASTIRYAIGPVAYRQMGGILPSGVVGFSEDAEAVTARYNAAGAQNTLTLILYPTGPMAAAHLKAIDKLATAPALSTKRVGPLLAIVSSQDPAAKHLLALVHFNDVVTMDRPDGYVSEAAKLAQLLLGIAGLTGFLVAASLLVALFLGGGRALVRIARGKPASSASDEEFISLHLS